MTASSDQSSVHAPANVQPAPDATLRLSLACPQCGVTGWVKWTSLARGIHCPKCQCEFLIAKNGQVASYRDLPQTRYSCPRCGKSGSLPTQLVVRKAECVDCKLPLMAGPDHQLHGVKEATALRRVAEAQARDESYAAWLKANLRHGDGRIRRWRLLAIVCCLAVAVTLITAAVRSWLDDSVETAARRFTQACLADNRSGRKYLPEGDEVQRLEFDRWWTRHFASIEAKHRPKGDRVRVEVDPSADGSPLRTLKIHLTSEFFGTRTLEQIWREQNGLWTFDCSETLAMTDRAPPPSAPRQRTATPRQRSSPR